MNCELKWQPLKMVVAAAVMWWRWLVVPVVAVAMTWHWWSSIILIHPCCVPQAGHHCCHGGGNNTYNTNVSYKETNLKKKKTYLQPKRWHLLDRFFRPLFVLTAYRLSSLPITIKSYFKNLVSNVNSQMKTKTDVLNALAIPLLGCNLLTLQQLLLLSWSSSGTCK